MDSFEKKIKNAFEQTNNVPSDFGWDDMEAGIYEKMGGEKKRKPIIFWFLGAIATIVIGSFLFINGSKTDKTSIPVVEISKPSQLNLANKTDKEINSTLTNTNNSIEKKTTLDTNKSLLTLEKTNGKVKQNSERNINSSIYKKKNIQTNFIRNQTSNIVVNEVVLNQENSNIKNADQNIRFDYSLLKSIDIVPIANRLKMKHFELINKSNSPVKYEVDDENIKVISIAISGGANYWNANFKKPMMKEFSQNRIGFYNHIQGNYAFSKKWGVNLGYQYQFLTSFVQFEKEDQVDVTFKDIVLQVNEQSYSADVSERRGDTTVLRDRVRKILKNNNFKSHSLSLGVTRSFKLGKRTSFGIDGGVEYMLTQRSTGISFDEQEEYVAFNITHKNQLALSLGTSLSFKVSNRWSSFAQVGAKQYLGDWNIVNNNILKPMVFNIGLGIRYTL